MAVPLPAPKRSLLRISFGSPYSQCHMITPGGFLRRVWTMGGGSSFPKAFGSPSSPRSAQQGSREGRKHQSEGPAAIHPCHSPVSSAHCIPEGKRVLLGRQAVTNQTPPARSAHFLAKSSSLARSLGMPTSPAKQVSCVWVGSALDAPRAPTTESRGAAAAAAAVIPVSPTLRGRGRKPGLPRPLS